MISFPRVFSLFPLIHSLCFWWGTEQKMARSVNKAQTDIMLNKMQTNRAIACGFVKLPKDVVVDFWNCLTDELNSAGPPIKNITEWKKVWTDQKRYVRSKAAANLKNIKGTGGGPNNTKCLSVNEEFIYELVGMKESVEGVENSLIFGLPQCSHSTENQSDTQKKDGDDEVIISDNQSIFPEQMTPPRQKLTTTEDSSEKTPRFLKRKRADQHQKLSTADLIAKEVETQENIYAKIAEIAGSTQTHNKEMETTMRRVYSSLEKNNDLKSKELQMLERHHKVCEELRRKEVESKIEKNKRLLEIEEIKLAILKENARM